MKEMGHRTVINCHSVELSPLPALPSSTADSNWHVWGEIHHAASLGLLPTLATHPHSAPGRCVRLTEGAAESTSSCPRLAPLPLCIRGRKGVHTTA